MQHTLGNIPAIPFILISVVILSNSVVPSNDITPISVAIAVEIKEILLFKIWISRG